MKNTQRIINDFYLSIGVDRLDYLNKFYISKALKFTLYFDNQHSKIYLDPTLKLLIIDNRLDNHTQRENFFHLLAQYLIHHNNPSHLQPVDEFKLEADHLSLHLAMPQHLLSKVDLTHVNLTHNLSETFNISHQMAQRRVNQIKT